MTEKIWSHYIIWRNLILERYLRLPYTFRGCSRISNVVRPVYAVDTKPLYQIKAHRAGYQTVLRKLKNNELPNFSRPLNASALIESYKSKRSLFFAKLFVPSVSGPKALNNISAFSIFNWTENLQNIFEIGLRKCEVIVQKTVSEK